MKLRTIFVSVVILLVLHSLSSAVPAQPEKAVAVTILKADIAGRIVLLRYLDGKEETVQFASGVSVTSIAEAAMNQRLSVGAGYQFLIVCSVKYGQKIITAFYYAGSEQWKTIRGEIETVDTAGRTIVLKTDVNSNLTFHAGENCSLNTNTGVKKFDAWPPLQSWNSRDVVAYYMETKTGRILQLVELPAQ